jgi:hypothetical protein
MASTITISGSAGWAQAFGGYKGLFIGANNEPSITSSNIILQTIINPPFCWNWNRATVSFLTTVGVQDYPTSVTAFGYIEKASFIPAATITNTALTSNLATYTAANKFVNGNLVTVTGTTNGAGVFNVTAQPIVTATATSFTVAITNANIGSAGDTGTAISGQLSEITNITGIQGAGNDLGPPNNLAPQIDNNAGSITFRIGPAADQIYQITIIYQQSAALISTPSTTWAPIPDKYAQIYQWGFLALTWSYFGDARWEEANRKFVTSLLGIAEGLTEEQKNSFQTAWLSSITEISATNLKAQQGIQSRGN